MAARLILAVLLALVPAARSLAAPDYRALLVGVSEYPALGPERQLRGPRNDVRDMRATLRALHGDWRSIRVLADGVNDADGLPTHAAITGEMLALARAVRAGDFVVLYFSGHGSQQPARTDRTESDGFDEIFLPRDIGRWDDGAGTVRNALTDDRIRELIAPLLEAGADVWAIFDTCHAGTMSRGALLAASEVPRAVRPAELGVPLFGERAARSIAAAARGERAVADNLVVFSAARSDETTPELRLPSGDPRRTEHGLFSFTLAQALRLNAASDYSQLARFIATRYALMQRTAPTPGFEGRLERRLPFTAGPSAALPVMPVRVSEPVACARGAHAAPCGSVPAAPGDAALRADSARWLRELAARDARLQRVALAADADVALIVRGGRVFFVAPFDDYAVGGRLPAAARDATGFNEALRSIANVQRLFNLARAPAAPLPLRISMHRASIDGDRCGGVDPAPLDLSGAPPTLPAGTGLCAILRNEGALPLDVTLLHVGSDYAVQPLFPLRGETNRLAPAQERRIALELVADEGPALDRLLALAVEAQELESIDFSWAAQPGIDSTARGTARAASPVWMQTLRWISAPTRP